MYQTDQFYNRGAANQNYKMDPGGCYPSESSDDTTQLHYVNVSTEKILTFWPHDVIVSFISLQNHTVKLIYLFFY